ncbi:glutamate racemase [Aquimarina sp. TRL1]|uniref:glutamate racemase n=1 Tax=Aquimarina sp. (strain TRL1) TaxID=2736252 RepID=UPI00158EFD53|nr:glutamate racemase [Aquimarina sp. TRL1]QKX05183.1 glutamate racemase [Aquimarina sp. TRL1]
MNNGVIGIFDSGLGGTSIWKEVASVLPNENTIYLADSKHAPYGKRSKEEIISLSIKNTEKLLNLNAKVIIVACNTATTNAIDVLRNSYDIPFIGIEPAIKTAALKTRTKKVGVLATQGTLSSRLFNETSDLYAKEIDVIEVVGTGLVELIESGDIDSPEMRSLLNSYITPLVQKNIDHLVLGCTHYPYLLPILNELLPQTTVVIDSGEAVAKQTKNILDKHQLITSQTTKGTHSFYTNKEITPLKNILAGVSFRHTVDYLDF